MKVGKKTDLKLWYRRGKGTNHVTLCKKEAKRATYNKKRKESWFASQRVLKCERNELHVVMTEALRKGFGQEISSRGGAIEPNVVLT